VTIWRAIRRLVVGMRGDYDLREYFISIGLGIMAMNALQLLTGPLPTTFVSLGSLVLILVVLLGIIPRLPPRWRGRR
jgi:hypothetical protein